MRSATPFPELFAQNPLPMFVFDEASLRLLDVNAAAIKELASSREALLSMTVKDLLDRTPFEVEVTTHRVEGTAPPIGLGVASNVAQRKASEQLLRRVNEELVLSGLREQAARDEAERANTVKDEFLAIMSHELRTPLQAMMGWLALLRSGTLDTADSAHALDVIERNTRIQAQLVADLLDVSRAQSGKLRLEPRRVDLRAVVAAAVESAGVEAARKQVRLEARDNGGAVAVQVDPVRLEQVAANLLSNAIKFSPVGGTVRVAVDADSAGAHLRVTDSGEGFDSAFMASIFQPFSQENVTSARNHGGLGLGLMIVRHLVEAHGGRVRAESGGKGHGASFIVDLPLDAGATGTQAADAPAEHGGASFFGRTQEPLAGLRALVVEDHPDSREFVCIALRRSGAEVRAAASAGEALAALDAAPVDIIVSDLGMPEQDGYAFLRALRQRDGPERTVPVIALSAFAGAEDRDRVLAAGFSAHAAKPVDPRQLIEVVARAAGRMAA